MTQTVCAECGWTNSHWMECSYAAPPQEERELTTEKVGYYDRLMAVEAEQTRVASAKVGIGGGPTRATTLPEDSAERKKFPIASGFLDYFPDAVVAVSHVSWKGNEQHNPGQSLRWDRSKSKDEWNTLMRHFMQRGTFDSDGLRHSAKVAWRAMSALQREIEEEQEKATPPPANVLPFKKAA